MEEKLLLPIRVHIFKKNKYPIGLCYFIDISAYAGRILPNMFRDQASILRETKSKRKPTFATAVVGFGHVSVNQEKGKDLL